jgi:hypothetical protein
MITNGAFEQTYIQLDLEQFSDILLPRKKIKTMRWLDFIGKTKY